MHNKTILITIFLSLTFSIGLSACGSKATGTVTHPKVVQPTSTEPPAVQATDTQPPVIQATVSQPPAVQVTNTPPPVNTATITPATADGAALLNERCTVCHNLNRVTSKKYSTDQWNQVVSKMIQNGAQLSSVEQKVLVSYLTENYGP